MCVCVWNRTLESRERGRHKGLSRKKTTKTNNRYTLMLKLHICTHIYIGICILIYSVQCIYRYMSVYISVYITGRGRRLVCSVHSYAPPLTAAIVYRYIYRYIPIYRYIEEGGLCAVCTPISAADGSRHRYIHRYMPIYYIRRRVFSAHSSTPPLTAAGIPIYTPIYTDILAGVC